MLAVAVVLLVIAFRERSVDGGEGGGGDRGSAPAPPGGGEPATVRSITDGDTLRLTDGRRVRLVQIDAPELGECFHEEAGAVLARLTPPGAEVRLTADPGLDARDEHGRLLRYVLLSSGVNANVEAVRRGAAVPYFFRRAKGALAAELEDALSEAREARLGLWSACPGTRLDHARGALTGPAR